MVFICRLGWKSVKCWEESGERICEQAEAYLVCDGIETSIEPDMAFWVRAGEMHQIINTGRRVYKAGYCFCSWIQRLGKSRKDC